MYLDHLGDWHGLIRRLTSTSSVHPEVSPHNFPVLPLKENPEQLLAVLWVIVKIVTERQHSTFIFVVVPVLLEVVHCHGSQNFRGSEAWLHPNQSLKSTLLNKQIVYFHIYRQHFQSIAVQPCKYLSPCLHQHEAFLIDVCLPLCKDQKLVICNQDKASPSSLTILHAR